MTREWNLHYASWVIDDGEPDLHVGDEFTWHALGFWCSSPLVRSKKKTKSADPIGDGLYRVNAEVTYIKRDKELPAVILDCGLKAACPGANFVAAECREGDHVRGEIALDLPGFSATQAYDLSHRWRVNKISADLTPFISGPFSRVFVRDRSQIRYQSVAGTDSVRACSYLLNCTLLT